MVANNKRKINMEKNEIRIKVDTAIQFLRQFPVPLGKMVSGLFPFKDPINHIQKTKKFHQLVLLYSAAIISSVYNNSYNYLEFLKTSGNDPQSLEKAFKKKPLSDTTGSNAVEPFHHVNWKKLNDWTVQMKVPTDEKNSKIKKVAWSEENFYDYLKDLGNELGFLRNFRVFKYEKTSKKISSLSERFPAFDLKRLDVKIVYEEGDEGRKIFGVPENVFEKSILITYNIVGNIFIPLTPFVIRNKDSFFLFKEFKGQKAVYQKFHNVLEINDEEFVNESEILPECISFPDILNILHKKGGKAGFPRPQWHDEFLLSLVTEEKGANQGVPNLLLRKNDEIIFTAEGSRRKRKMVIQEIVGEGMGRGVFTEVWQVKEERTGQYPLQHAIKILKPIFANTLIDEEFNREIENMQSLAKAFDESEAEKYKRYFFIEVLENGNLSFNKWWDSPCFLMEPAEISLRHRLDNFKFDEDDKEETHMLLDSSNSIEDIPPEKLKKLYSRIVWAFYCMRHLVAICEKLHSFGGSLCHCNIKPENILYFAKTQGRTPLLSDFGLAKNNKNNEEEKPKRNISERRKLKVFQHSVYAAPELKKDPPMVSLRTDQYSLGIIFFELIFGEVPRLENVDEEVFPDKDKIVGYFGKLDKVLGIGKFKFQPFIKKVLGKNHKNRFDSVPQEGKYSDFRKSFFKLEEQVLQNNVAGYFVNVLIPEAKNLLNDGKTEEALNKIDLLFHDAVRYCCLFKEQKEEEEISKVGKEHTYLSCRFFKGNPEDPSNPMNVIEGKIPDPDKANIGAYEKITILDISEVFKQLDKVLGKCYGFLSHCHPHNSYRQRLSRLLTSFKLKEHKTPVQTGDTVNNMDAIDKILLMILQQTFRKEKIR